MAKFNVNADCTMTKAKTTAKAELMEVIENALKEHYGEDSVMWVRSVGSSPKNEIGVIVGDIAECGFEYDLTFTVDTTCKPYKAGKRGKTEYEAYDIEEAHEAYEVYLTEKIAKQAEAKAKKVTNSKSKSKKEKEEELAKREAELNEAMNKAKEKREKETKKIRENQSTGAEIVKNN